MNRLLAALTSTAAVIFMFLSGCGNPFDNAVQFKPKRIAVAEMIQETNDFSTVLTGEENFRSESLLRGEEILPFAKKEKLELGGFIKAIEKHGRGSVEILPILKARSSSGGPLERDLYERFKGDIISGLRKSGKLDGVYLALHGATGVDGLRDPEGDLLAAVRDEVGPTVPIAVTFDLHANVTRRQVELATFILGYRTNPNRDQFDTGYSAGELLLKTARGEIKPVMEYRKMRLLRGGGMVVDFLPPMQKVFSEMKRMLKINGVLGVSTFISSIWQDDPELGWSTVVITENKPELAAKIVEELADINWAARESTQLETHTPSEAIAIARSKAIGRKFGCIVFCDASDSVGTGTPGESTWILTALMNEAKDLVSYVPLRDKESASIAYQHAIGDTVTVTVGGKLDKVFNRPVEFTGKLVRKKEGRLGKAVVLKRDGIHLILTELPDPAARPGYFGEMDLSLWKADIVVVKNLFPFRIFYLLYNRGTVDVVTPGLSNIDVFALPYSSIPRPIYPLDKIDSWR